MGDITHFPTDFAPVTVELKDNRTVTCIKTLQEQARQLELLRNQTYAAYDAISMMLLDTHTRMAQIQGREIVEAS